MKRASRRVVGAAGLVAAGAWAGVAGCNSIDGLADVPPIAVGDGGLPVEDSSGGVDVTQGMDVVSSAMDSTVDVTTGSDAPSGSDVTTTADSSPSDAPAEDTSPSCDGGAFCSGVCTLIESDTKNCGRCNHDCLGGDCKVGVCEPITVVAANGATNLASDGTNVYWIAPNSTGGVLQASLSPDDAGPPITLSTSGFGIAAFAVAGTNVYWDATNPGTGGVYLYHGTVGVAGGQSALTTFSAASTAAGMFYDPTGSAVWLTFAVSSNYGIVKCPVTGAACGNPIEFGGVPTFNAVTDGTYGFFGDKQGGVIEQVTLANGDATEIKSGANTPTVLAMGSGFVYWVESGTDTLWRVASAGGAVEQVGVTAGTNDGLVADAVYMYWTDTTSGTINYSPIGGGGTQHLYVNQGGASGTPMRLVGDGVSLLWLYGPAGTPTIYRIALP